MAEITSLITIASDLKKKAASYHVEQFNKSNFFQENIKKKLAKLSATGREYLIPMLLGDNQSFKGSLEGEDLATPGTAIWDEVALSRKYTDARLSITDQAMQVSKGNEASWIQARTMEERGLMREFNQKYSELWYGWGTGAIARVNGAPGNTTFVVDDDQATGAGYTFGTKYLKKGMVISASSTLTGYVADRTFKATIEGVNNTTLTITVSNCQDLADGDYILWEDSLNRMPTGLMGIIDDGTFVATYGGKTRATAGNEWLHGYVYDVNGAITENRLITTAHTVEQNIGVIPTLAVTTYGGLRAVANLFVGDRRFMISETTAGGIGYKGGWSGVSIQLGSMKKLNILTDRKCPKGNMFMPNLEDFVIYQLGEPHWLSMDGESVYRWVPNKRAWEAAWVYDCEFFSERPMASARLHRITES